MNRCDVGTIREQQRCPRQFLLLCLYRRYRLCASGAFFVRYCDTLYAADVAQSRGVPGLPFVVELEGIEPSTSSMPLKRSPK